MVLFCFNITKTRDAFRMVYQLRERALSMLEEEGMGAGGGWGGGGGGFYKFFKKNFVTQETIDLNILWPRNFFRKYFMVPPINFSFLFKTYLQHYFRVVFTAIFKFQITKEVNIHNDIQKIIFIQIKYPKNLCFCHIKILLQQ